MKNGAVGKLTAKMRERKNKEDARNCPFGSCSIVRGREGRESRSYPVKKEGWLMILNRELECKKTFGWGKNLPNLIHK